MADDPDVHSTPLAGGRGHPSAWFEQLYVDAAHGRAEVPWDRPAASAAVADWAAARSLAGVRALVVGCGLGRDAELLAGHGADVVAFDISPTAVATARERHPGSAVEYTVADLLAPPTAWRQSFGLVVESMNIQALPGVTRTSAIAAVGTPVAPGGTLLVHEAAATGADEPGPPWPMTRAEIESFAQGGLLTVSCEGLQDTTQRFVERWRAEFVRPR